MVFTIGQEVVCTWGHGWANRGVIVKIDEVNQLVHLKESTGSGRTGGFTFDHIHAIPEPEPGDDFYQPPSPEAPPIMGWFAALAEENIINVIGPTHDRSIAIAQVYALLEIAAAIDRSRS